MRIAIASSGGTPNSNVDSRFGRAPFFAVYETEAQEWTFISNSQNLQAPQGAGIQSAQQVAETGANALICGNVGPKAMSALRAAGIRVFQASEQANLNDTIKQFLGDGLDEMSEPNVPGHWS